MSHEDSYRDMQNGSAYEKDRPGSNARSYHDDDGIVTFPKSRTNSERSLTISYSSSYYEDVKHLETPGAEKPKFGAKLPVVLCILFTEMCERLVFYGVSGNLLVFLTSKMSMHSDIASSIVLIFTGNSLNFFHLFFRKSLFEQPSQHRLPVLS